MIDPRLAYWLEPLLAWAQRVLGVIVALALVGLIGAALFGSSRAAAQLLLPDGTVNPECAAEPRVPPLPVPPLFVPAQADLPAQAVVTVASSIPRPAELPAQIGGTGTRALVDLNTKGVAIGWWVPKVGVVHLHLQAVTWRHLIDNPGLAARLLLLAAAPTRDSATVAAIGAAYPPTLNIRDMCDVWAPLVAPLNASKPAPLSPPPALSPYVVTAAGTATVRPAYPVINGKRSTLAAGSAVPGQPCDCAALQIIEFNVARYCASPSITGISGPAVTACSPRR